MFYSLKRQLLASCILACALATLLVSSGAASPIAGGANSANPAAEAQAAALNWSNVPTQFVSASGVTFAYRELGRQNGGAPVVFLGHLAAVLDNWDPRVVEGIAQKRHVVVFDNRGVGASSGSSPTTIENMADDAITFIRALGYQQVDLFGFSMGGMISQEIALKEPQLVRKMILAGTGPAGGEGISSVAGVANIDMIRGLFTGQDPKQFLFFTRTPSGIEAGKAYLARLKERTENRDKEISIGVYIAQLRALEAWGQKNPVDLSAIKQPVLIANGNEDRMVPTGNSRDLARRLPNSSLIIYPDAGHGGVFQFYSRFVPEALEFLAR